MSDSQNMKAELDNRRSQVLRNAIFNYGTDKKESTHKILTTIPCSVRIKNLTDINETSHYDSMALLKRFLFSHKSCADLTQQEISLKVNENDDFVMHENIPKDGDAVSLKAKTEKFISLQEFKNANTGKNIVQDNEILVVQNLPRFVTGNNILIEHLIEYVLFKIIGTLSVQIKEQVLELNLDYQWSIICNDSFIAPKSVFVKFNDIFTVYIFHQILNGLNVDSAVSDSMHDDDYPHINVFATTQLKENVFPKIEELLKIDKIPDYQQTVKEQIDYIYNISDYNNSIIGVDEYTKMYNNYKIDAKDISHIPSDMLEIVKNNLIEFRLLALKVEKERKEKRKLQEEIRTHEKLKALLRTMDQKRENIDDNSKQANKRTYHEDDDTLTDLELETKRLNQRNLESEKRFSETLTDVKRREAKRLLKYKKYKSSLKHDVYVSHYIPMMKKQFFEKFVDPVKDDKNSIDKSFSYYTVHSNYVKFRQQNKIDEERRDEEDRQSGANEENEREGEDKSDDIYLEEDKLKTKPEKLDNNDILKATDYSQTNGDKTEKGNLSTKELEKLLKPTVEAEIVKYLGVSEPSVVNFVLSFVTSNPVLNKKSSSYSEFISELSELLEDDAPKAVEFIYKQLHSLV